nr:methyltransferase domain-containing protein [Kofleriaceae bacterium]
MSKRDDEADLGEVGMTTAERRRRRRRGALRVPSDNVPRQRAPTSPPVVAPVPEDPALAMSIAYSFSNDASEPVPHAVYDESSRRSAPHAAGSSAMDPIAPEGMPTVIDPPSAPVEQQDFEMKTREMAAVDLEALGLSSSGIGMRAPVDNQTTTPMPVMRTPSVIVDDSAHVAFHDRSDRSPTDVASLDVDVDVSVDGGTTLETETTGEHTEDDVETTTISAMPQAPSAAPTIPGASAAAAAAHIAGPPTTPAAIAPVAPPASPTAPGTPTAMAASGEPAPLPDAPARPGPSKPPRERLKTMALSEDDLEEVMEAARAATQGRAATPVPAAVPEGLDSADIEISTESAPIERGSGEINIDIDYSAGESAPNVVIDDSLRAPAPTPAAPAPARPSAPASAAPPPAPPARTTTPRAGTAPVVAQDKAPPPPPPAAAKADKHDDKASASPPPPPDPARRGAPPTPPPPTKKVSTSAQSAVAGAQAARAREQRGKPWFVDLFDEDYLRTLPFLTPQATQAEAEFVIEAMGLQPGAQLLDVGCGYGRHAMELAARGYHVVGLDLSTPLLVRGGEEAHRRNLTINFVRGDMRELDFDSQFDGAYCLFSTFGYFDDETNKKTLANVARALRPGGRVLIEILNRDYVIADLPTRVWWEGDGCVVLEEVDLNYFSSRIQVNRSVVFDDGRQLEQEISLRAYSLHEVGKLMHAAGFRVLEVSGGYQTRGRFFGNQSRHIIVLAERKEPSGSGG